MSHLGQWSCKKSWYLVLWGLPSWKVQFKSHLSISTNLLCANTQKLYMISISYFQDRSILHGTFAVVGYFDLLIFSLENMTFTLKFMFWPLPLYPETINSNCFILSGYINLPGDYVLWGYFDLLTFEPHIMTVILKILMTFTIQILSRSALRNYTW